MLTATIRYHGFVLDPNKHDCARLEVSIDLVPGTTEPLLQNTSEFEMVKQRLIANGFRGLDYTACVAAGSNQLDQLYQFIAIKYGTPDVTPHINAETYSALSGEIETIIAEYDVQNQRPGYAQTFIKCELHHLRSFQGELADLAWEATTVVLTR